MDMPPPVDPKFLRGNAGDRLWLRLNAVSTRFCKGCGGLLAEQDIDQRATAYQGSNHTPTCPMLIHLTERTLEI